MGIGAAWDFILVNPILNLLIALAGMLGQNLGYAIIIFTIVVRLVLLPLTIKQLRASKVMSEKMRDLQPRLQELQKKYARDKQKLSQETMKLYKEMGMSPLGCLSSPMVLPMLIQMPIWIALYQAINKGLDTSLENLSEFLYSWSLVQWALGEGAMEYARDFLWLDLGARDPYFILPVLIIISMWVSQKMVTPPATDPKQAQMNKMMQLMMPLMFGFITFTLPNSGLPLYWLVSNVISIGIQYFIYGWSNLRPSPSPVQPLAADPKSVGKKTKKAALSQGADIVVSKDGYTRQGEKSKHGRNRSKRKNS